MPVRLCWSKLKRRMGKSDLRRHVDSYFNKCLNRIYRDMQNMQLYVNTLLTHQPCCNGPHCTVL